MASPRKKNTGTTQATSVNPAQLPVTTPYVQSSMPSSSAASFSPVQANTSSIPSCPSAFVCGQQNHELTQKIHDLEDRIVQLEETSTEKRVFLKKAESLLLVFKAVLLAMPITLFIAIAIVQFFFYKDSSLLNIVTGIIGLAAIAECIFIPAMWSKSDNRLSEVEERLKDD